MQAAITSLGADILATMFSVFDVEALFAMVCSCRALREKLQPTLRPIVAEGRLARRAQREMFHHLVAMVGPRIDTTRTGPGSCMSAVGPDGVSIITATTAPVRGRMEYVFTARACFDNVAGRSSIIYVAPRTETAGAITVDLAEGGGRTLGYCRGVVAALAALGY